MRSQPRKRKQQRSGGKEGINFAISLITMTVVFVFIGYLLGQYAVKLLRAQHSAQVRVVQTTTPQLKQGSLQRPYNLRQRHHLLRRRSPLRWRPRQLLKRLLSPSRFRNKPRTRSLPGASGCLFFPGQRRRS